MIRVLIVDDSPFMRRILSDILKLDKDIIVVGQANNGKEALEKIPTLNPDVITMDIEMPIMDGITALEYIVKDHNIPVVMISSLTEEGATLTLKALDIGAIDFIPKPKNIFSLSDRFTKMEIINKVKEASRSKINLKYEGKKISTSSINYLKPSKWNNEKFEYIIAIGTSTGGPRALQSVIPLLPEDINGSIVVVQHMPPKFTKSLADRLNTMSNIKVKEGEEGEKLKRGYCYIAPGDFHMKIAKKAGNYIIELDKGLPVKGLRPAADILMESVAELKDLKKIGVVLTGMGSDGSDGVSKIKESNGYTIAQDEETSVIFGMPKAAIDTNNIDKIVPLNSIAHEIMSKMGV